jgi:hypothetical protein
VCSVGARYLLYCRSLRFRIGLAHAQGREDVMIWFLSRGQTLDMIAGAASNLRFLKSTITLRIL